MKRHFHKELENLRSKLALMGEKCTDAVQMAVQGLLENENELLREAIALDDAIDDLETDINHDATRYITLRAPVASDLRLLCVAIKASHDFERVGDEATSIAKLALEIHSGDSAIHDWVNIKDMCDLTIAMHHDALQCLIGGDASQTQEIITRDKLVDQLNRENKEAFTQMIHGEKENVTACINAIFISKSLERIGDHAKNLAEEVAYLMHCTEPLVKRAIGDTPLPFAKD